MGIIDKEIQKLIASKVKNQFGNSDEFDVKIEKKNGQATNVFCLLLRWRLKQFVSCCKIVKWLLAEFHEKPLMKLQIKKEVIYLWRDRVLIVIVYS